jgi:GST-like protein
MVHQAFRKPGSLKRGCYCLSLWSRKGDFHDGTRLSFITGPPPNGWKISIMLEELGVPHKVKYINIGKGEQFTSEFLKIVPNNRMPAIVDPDGPGGEPVSVFDSGAILQYLGRKFGKFYSTDERTRVQIEEWPFWQVGGLRPVAGQAHHFRGYAPEKIEYGINRYTNEVNRLYGVMNKRLAEREYLGRSIREAGTGPERVSQPRALFETMMERPAVVGGTAIGKEKRERSNLADDKEAQKILFNQRAR